MTTPDAAAGRFVWHDLMTTDPAAALAFYTALFGWTTRSMPMGEAGDYTMLFAGEEGVGGVVPLDASHGVTPHWIGYATVPSVDAACRAAEQAGGATCVPATDIPTIGRFAVVEDPAGAVISPFCARPDQELPERDGPPPVGVFCWDELVTSDVEASRRFHERLFGWRYEPMEMGPLGTYWVGHRGERQATGLMRLPEGARARGERSHWLSYVAVADVDAAARRATELGGTPLAEPLDVPGMGRFVVVRDPAGARVAAFSASG